jgi:hypothetical protein
MQTSESCGEIQPVFHGIKDQKFLVLTSTHSKTDNSTLKAIDNGANRGTSDV